MSDRDIIADRSAWRTAELLADRSWLLPLAAAQVAEVSAAVDAVAARGLRAGEFGRDEFALPLTAPLLADALDRMENDRGVALIRGLPMDGRDQERAARIAWGLGLHLGRALRQNPRVNLADYKDNLLGVITDQGYDYNAPNAIGSGTSAEQMPHVDGSDLVGLLCVRPAADGGGISRVASSMAIHNALLAQPAVLDTLYEGFVHDLRGDVAPGSARAVTPRIPVFSQADGVLSCNFNSKTVEMAAIKLGRALSAAERRALDAVLALATSPEYALDMPLACGDFQLVNNYTVLHSRGAWRDPPQPDARRLMLRLWLRNFAPRPLAPGFAGGYVTGAVHDVTTAALAS